MLGNQLCNNFNSGLVMQEQELNRNQKGHKKNQDDWKLVFTGIDQVTASVGLGGFL